ncbi:MAG: alpha/beta hydrolase [Cyanobacteria bacterium J06631_6]
MANNSLDYNWQDWRCTYSVSGNSNSQTVPLVLIHPVGVGLSRKFWQRFTDEWLSQNPDSLIYNPDLLGCGAGDMPAIAYYPIDWAKQLEYFMRTIVQQPVILLVQGASLPIAIKLTQLLPAAQIKGLVLSAPPAWRTMTDEAKPRQQKLLWNVLFDSPLELGNLFYRYARRRQFLESFSIRQLFAEPQQVDRQWLDELITGSENMQSRYAVFSFLAGFWRENYGQAIAKIQQPTLVVFGEQSSSISREGKAETVPERLAAYTAQLSQGEGCVIPGRNVLPYESTKEFVRVVNNFWQQYRLISN